MGRPMAEVWIPGFRHKFTDAGWEVVVSAAEPPLSAEDFVADAHFFLGLGRKRHADRVADAGP